eukprot:GHVR01189181.1.p1 GENE.GHVR01189181.1~~GHVR01189181.1.p1  ORF type:complete len:114 (+),score=9.25 GHVR01189181.1:139-480(+)
MASTFDFATASERDCRSTPLDMFAAARALAASTASGVASAQRASFDLRVATVVHLFENRAAAARWGSSRPGLRRAACRAAAASLDPERLPPQRWLHQSRLEGCSLPLLFFKLS